MPHDDLTQGATSQLRSQVEDLRAALDAIRLGGVDAVVCGPPGHEQVYTLTSADEPYRVIIREMNEGAVTVSQRGVVLFANPKFGDMLGRDPGSLLGTPIADAVFDGDEHALAELLAVRPGDQVRAEVRLAGSAGTVPSLLAASGLELEDMTVVCLVATDLTEQKKVEATLRANEQQLTQRAAEIERINANLERTVEERTAQLRVALRDLESHLKARLNYAREVNDTIVQVLVAAETAADLGRTEECRELLGEASRAARNWIGEQLRDAGPIVPGSLVRTDSAEYARAAKGSVR